MDQTAQQVTHGTQKLYSFIYLFIYLLFTVVKETNLHQQQKT